MTVQPDLGAPSIVTRQRVSRHRIWVLTAGLMIFYMWLGLAMRYPLGTAKVPVTGDEQHYLTQAFSVIHDRDLTVIDNYVDGDYVTFYGSSLGSTAWNLKGVHGYSGHAPGAGLLVAPGMWAAGWVGVLATLAGAMAATFAITASTLARLLQRPLPTPALVLLTTGFLSLPLLAYSHTLYPDPFMALVVAALGWMTLIQLQTTVHSHRSWACLAAICLSGLSMALHPRYFVVLVGVTLLCMIHEFSDESSGPAGTKLRTSLVYLGVGGGWLLLFSWFHDIMWDVFHPGGWFVNLRDRLGVEARIAFIQLLDLFIGRENGLFVLSPLTILSVAFLFRAFRRGSGRVQRRFGVFVLVLAATIVGPAAFSPAWSGGDSPLGRYASPLTAILLLTGVFAAMQPPWTIGRRVLLGFLAAIGLLGSLAYFAQPNAFRPHADTGSGAIAVISDNVSLLANLESWIWSATSPRLPWVGAMIWIFVIGLALWMFARPDDRLQRTSPAD